MERSDAARTREGHDGRSPFEAFTERINHWMSSPLSFLVCLVIVLVWVVSVPLWVDLKAWQVAIHTVASVLSLLLLVLLENAARRHQETAQEKLNVIAEALAALMTSHAADDAELREATEKLRQAVGLEERH